MKSDVGRVEPIHETTGDPMGEPANPGDIEGNQTDAGIE